MHSYIRHSVIIIVFWNGSFLRSSLAYWIIDFPFPALKVRSDGHLSASLSYFLHLLSSSSHEIRVFGFRKGSVVRIKFVILAHVPCHLWEVFRLHLILFISRFLAKPEDNLEGSIGKSLSHCSSSLKDKVLLRRQLSFGWMFSLLQPRPCSCFYCLLTNKPSVCAIFHDSNSVSGLSSVRGHAHTHMVDFIYQGAMPYHTMQRKTATLEVPPRVLHSRAAPSPWHVLLLAVGSMQPPPQKETCHLTPGKAAILGFLQ